MEVSASSPTPQDAVLARFFVEKTPTRNPSGRTPTDFMFTLEHCRKILGKKADGLTDEQVEAVRDELYIAANLAFSNWQSRCTSAKADESSSTFAGVQPASTPHSLRENPRTLNGG